MKLMLVGIGVAVFLVFAMVAWSVAGRLMTAKDDMSVVMGLGIAGALLGLSGAGITAVLRKVFMVMDDSAKKEER